MPRRKRMCLSGLPFPVVQHGKNPEACFVEPENYPFYVALWQTYSKRWGMAFHANCLMTNRVHFLVTSMNPDSISRAMSVIGSRYTRPACCMRTLANPLKHMNRFEISRIFEKYTMYPTRLCSFWENFSGHFARLTCDHNYGFVHCLIFMGPNQTCVSLKFPQDSAFACNMRASISTAQLNVQVLSKSAGTNPV